MGYVTRTGNNHLLASKALAVSLEHFFCVVNQAIACCFWTDQAAAKSKRFTSQDTSIELVKAFVLAIEVADFTSADTDITSWNVKRWTDVFLQFCHKALAEAHHFSISLTFGIKVRSTFTTADWQASQYIFKDLLKSEEFQDTLVYSWVETKSAFIRTNC